MKETKTCTRCQAEKLIKEFYGEKRSHCIDCEQATAKDRMKRYNATFRGKCQQALNDSRKAVRKIEREQGVSVENKLTLIGVLWILSEKDCAYCGKETEESDRQLEHITPIKYGGTNTFDNCTMACSKCNRLKSDVPVMLHMIREVDNKQAIQLIDKVASRKVVHFAEAFTELVEDAHKYYELRAEEMKERIQDEGKTT